MSDTSSKKPDRHRQRQERLEAELRANLQKRKAVVRARADQTKNSTADDAEPAND